MKFKGNKFISLVLALLMVALVVVPVSAVTATPAGKNTASRSTNAVALSGQAQEYYTDEIKSLYGSASSDTKVYQSFADLANNVTTNGEGTSWDAAQNNDLYDVLHNIMKDTHTHFTSYAGTSKNALATHWKTTDTSSSDAREYYTMFYSDKVVFNNEKMQREHIWPKSRASFLQATGGGGSDLHHLRPAYGPVNLAKLNYAFGNVKDKSYATAYGYPNEDPALWRATVYADNNTTYIDVRDDVRGDVARILLYVYTRWHEYNLYSDLTTTDDEGNTVPDMDKLRELDEDDKLKGNTGEKVIQSLPVLLQWMQQDPVSEWEMKRNDLTEDIQGNRNVFIDYPELAWLLFDRSVPSDMVTPSGMANSSQSDIDKVTTDNINDPVTIVFNKNVSGANGVADISIFDETTGKTVKPTIINAKGQTEKEGTPVERGDILTYTITPDESDIEIIRFNKTSGNGMFSSYPLTDGKFTFTKRAGYNWTDKTTPGQSGDTGVSTGNATDEFRIKLKSNVCELSYKVNGLSATEKSSGGGSGMVVARNAETNEIIENGGTVLNNTDVILTCTPDYGSRLAEKNSKLNPVQIEGTNSYEATVHLDCSSGSVRKKEYIIYFAQTFAKNNAKYISNKGMRPDADDEWGEDTDFTSNFEICGVQRKNTDDGSNALRFISVIDKDILSKAERYGYLLGTTNSNVDNKIINRYSYSLVLKEEPVNDEYEPVNGIKADCTGSDNNCYGDYGKQDTNKRYKYFTVAVNNIRNMDTIGIGINTKIIARPYVVIDDDYLDTGVPKVIYGQYVDISTGESYCACSGSYIQIAGLAS